MTHEKIMTHWVWVKIMTYWAKLNVCSDYSNNEQHDLFFIDRFKYEIIIISSVKKSLNFGRILISMLRRLKMYFVCFCFFNSFFFFKWTWIKFTFLTVKMRSYVRNEHSKTWMRDDCMSCYQNSYWIMTDCDLVRALPRVASGACF